MLRKGALIVTASAMLLMSSATASAAEGVLACVGRHVLGTVSGTFQLSNLNDSAALQIDRVRVYRVDGTLVCEGPAGWDIPDVLGPNQGTWFNVPRMGMWCGEQNVPEDIGWVIVKVYWSTPGRAGLRGFFPLYGRTTEVLRNDAGEMVGRSTLVCETASRMTR